MDQGRRRSLAATTAVVALLTLLLGCSGGGGDSDGEATCADPFSTNLAGNWTLTERFASNQPDCAGEDSHAITLAQEGGELVWTKPGTGSLLMKLCGRIIQVPAEARPMAEGLVLKISSYGALFDSEARFSGTTSFAIVVGANDSVVCSGTATIEGLRQ